jgi:hypothetical protein
MSKLQTSLKSLFRNGDKFRLSFSVPKEQPRSKLLASMASFVLTESSVKTYRHQSLLQHI